jgi:hypothetical protein
MRARLAYGSTSACWARTVVGRRNQFPATSTNVTRLTGQANRYESQRVTTHQQL